MNQTITVLCNCRFPSTAAHSLYLARACESFAATGASVELVVPKRFKEIRVNPLEYYSIQTAFTVRKIWSFDFLIFGRVLGRLAFIFQYTNFYVFTLCFFLFRSRNRIIYTMDNLGCLLSFFGYKVIFETHVGIGSYRKRLLPLLKRAKRIVTVNSIIKNDFVRAGFKAEDILVAPNGVDLSLFSGNESKKELRTVFHLPLDSKIIAYVGKYKTMGMDKGVDELVWAFGSLYSVKKEVHLLIVGLSDDEKDELAAVFEKIGIPKQVRSLVGHVSQVEVAKFMKAADVLVMNYPNTPYYANFMSPMKMFEYMAAGQPIVTSDLPAIREILNEETAVFVEPDNQASLEKGILRILLDETFGKKIADKAYEKVLDYTWKKRAERILGFI
ncbi:MAG: glycosyltransferase family 4 protein [bacterium]|nr:glycosyltransferase family 4 protein [bacterium]